MEPKGFNMNLLDLDIGVEKNDELKADEAEEDRIQHFDEYLKFTDPKNSQPTKNYKFWEINYYKPYFDVDTEVVVTRLKNSVNPINTPKLFEDNTPDLYGPV